MINVNKAKSILLKENKGAEVVSTGRYKDWYVFELKIPGNAIKIGNEIMELDPYWFVNSNSGEVEHYIRFYKPEIFNQIVWNDGKMYHHGILGMKWGIRRFQNKDGTYTAAGKKRYLKDSKIDNKDDGEYDSKSKSKFKLTNEQKKMVIAGSVAVGTALAIYGAYKFRSHLADKTSTNPVLNSKNIKIDNVESFFKQKTSHDPTSMDEIDNDLKVINHGLLGNLGLKGRSSNCPNCAMAYEMRRRGADVSANQLSGGRFINDIEDNIGRNFKFASHYGSHDDMIADLKSQPFGTRGFVISDGHINNYEVFSDGVYIMDAQINRKYNLSKGEGSLLIESMDLMGFARTDDIKFNSDVLEYVTNNDESQKLREGANSVIVGMASMGAGAATYTGLNSDKHESKEKENKESELLKYHRKQYTNKKKVR